MIKYEFETSTISSPTFEKSAKPRISEFLQKQEPDNVDEDEERLKRIFMKDYFRINGKIGVDQKDSLSYSSLIFQNGLKRGYSETYIIDYY